MRVTQSISEELVQIVDEATIVLEGIDERVAVTKPGPGVWSIKEIIGHLVDSAANNHQRFVRAQSVDALTFPSYDQDEAVNVQDFQNYSWPELIQFWRLYNRHLAHVIERIPADKQDVACSIGPNEPKSLEWLVQDYLVHLRHHMNQIEERRRR